MRIEADEDGSDARNPKLQTLHPKHSTPYEVRFRGFGIRAPYISGANEGVQGFG